MNRGFLYGDGFFDTLLIWEGKPTFWEYHWKRNVASANYLQMGLPSERLVLQQILYQTQNKSGRLRITFYRDGGGKYTPETNEATLHFSFEMMEQSKPYREHELVSFKVSEIDIPKHASGNYKLIGRHLNVLSSLNRTNESESILLNQDQELACGNVHNLILFMEGKWFTPSLESGCLMGTMRQWFLDHFSVEQKVLKEPDLFEAETILLSNSVIGFKPIQMDANFKSEYSMLIDQLNRAALNSTVGLLEN